MTDSGGIFISYRRDDTAPATGRLADLLDVPVELDPGRLEHPAGRVLEDVVDRLAEHRALPCRERPPRRAEHDDLGVARIGLGDDGRSGGVRSLEPGEGWRWCYVDEVPL